MLPADQKFWLLVEFTVVGILLVLICIPLILRKIPPNRWYGFRTPGTLGDAEIWYPVNALAGQRLAAAGVTIVAGAIGFYFLPRWETLHYAIAVMAVTLVSILYAVAESVRYLQQIKQERKNKLPHSAAEEPDSELES